jgi:hypothetical protein
MVSSSPLSWDVLLVVALLLGEVVALVVVVLVPPVIVECDLGYAVSDLGSFDVACDSSRRSA